MGLSTGHFVSDGLGVKVGIEVRVNMAGGVQVAVQVGQTVSAGWIISEGVSTGHFVSDGLGIQVRIEVSIAAGSGVRVRVGLRVPVRSEDWLGCGVMGIVCVGVEARVGVTGVSVKRNVSVAKELFDPDGVALPVLLGKLPPWL